MQMRIRSTVHNKQHAWQMFTKGVKLVCTIILHPERYLCAPVAMITFNGGHLFLFIYAAMVNESSISLVVSTRNNNIKPRQNNYTITNKQQHYTNTCLEFASKIRLNDIVMNPGFN